MYKIVPAERQKCSEKTITKNRCKPSKKRLTAVIFGTPGWVRTSGLSLRRRPLYPTELRGLIQKIFNFTGLQDSNDSIFRRRSLYTTELRGYMGIRPMVQADGYRIILSGSGDRPIRQGRNTAPYEMAFWQAAAVRLGRHFPL